ncbi:MAG: VUT family protein [Alphaproteobacteria bacterium]|nr:VUT family protein [Alphaproteobacteria bacterium]
MRAYESGALSGREDAPARLAIGINDGPYRLRMASDAAWTPTYGYGTRVTLGRRLTLAVRAVLRTVFPVLGLTAALVGLFLYLATPVPYLAHTAENWVTVSSLLLPVPFLAIHLTNRRYGPAYAFAQIILTFAVLGAVTIFAGESVHRFLPAAALPAMREVCAFMAAFVLSGFLSIVAFDGARGRRWWTAPLVGSLIGALSFAPAFYPAAYLGTSIPWFDRMLVETGVLCGGAILMLFPFWMLRRVVQPLSGFGGY